jgi:hypothetical protein
LAATLIPADCINRDKLSELLLADLVADYEEKGLNGLAAIQTARVLDPVAYLRVLAASFRSRDLSISLGH